MPNPVKGVKAAAKVAKKAAKGAGKAAKKVAKEAGVVKNKGGRPKGPPKPPTEKRPLGRPRGVVEEGPRRTQSRIRTALERGDEAVGFRGERFGPRIKTKVRDREYMGPATDTRAGTYERVREEGYLTPRDPARFAPPPRNEGRIRRFPGRGNRSKQPGRGRRMGGKD